MEQMGKGIRKLILAGIGAAAVGKEKSEVLLRELVAKGELTVEQGRALNEELKHNVKEAIRDNVAANLDLHGDLMDAVEYMDDEQLEMLKQRIHLREEMRQPAAEDSSMEAPPDTEE